MDTQTCRWTYRWAEIQTDRWTRGHANGNKDGLTYRQTDKVRNDNITDEIKKNSHRSKETTIIQECSKEHVYKL